MSIVDVSIATAPVAVVDTETTGLYARADRLVEISVVRNEPGAQAEVLVNTLINPQRPVGATEIHGITDDDVADAPAVTEAEWFTAKTPSRLLRSSRLGSEFGEMSLATDTLRK